MTAIKSLPVFLALVCGIILALNVALVVWMLFIDRRRQRELEPRERLISHRELPPRPDQG